MIIAESITSKAGSIVILFTLLLILSGCNTLGNKTIGEIEDVEDYMNSNTKDKVINVEMISIETISQRSDSHDFIMDGTIFYDGEDKIIPEYHIKTFRAFSQKLDSYVFLKFNEYTQKYTMVQNYDILEEKKEALELSKKVQDSMKLNHIRIEALYYIKFYNETTNIDDVYKLSDNYDDTSYSHQSTLWIMVNVNASADDVRSIMDLIQELINTTENYISLKIETTDSRVITFYKDGQPLIEDEDGFNLEF